jgi:hypothetical protein
MIVCCQRSQDWSEVADSLGCIRVAGGVVRYRLLGPLKVVADDGTVVATAVDKERILLAALLLAAGRVVTTSSLIDALWGENPPQQAAKPCRCRCRGCVRSCRPPRATERSYGVSDPATAWRL